MKYVHVPVGIVLPGLLVLCLHGIVAPSALFMLTCAIGASAVSGSVLWGLLQKTFPGPGLLIALLAFAIPLWVIFAVAARMENFGIANIPSLISVILVLVVTPILIGIGCAITTFTLIRVKDAKTTI